MSIVVADVDTPKAMIVAALAAKMRLDESGVIPANTVVN